MSDRKIGIKNYISLGLIIICSLFLIIYFYMWYLTYNESKLSKPIMNEYLQMVNYNELDNYLIENKDAMIYVSILKDEKIRNFEEKFKNYIKTKSLNGKILYMDLSTVIDEDKASNSISKDYIIGKKSIINVPCLVSFKAGKIKEIYIINENKYDMLEINFFLKQEGLFE